MIFVYILLAFGLGGLIGNYYKAADLILKILLSIFLPCAIYAVAFLLSGLCNDWNMYAIGSSTGKLFIGCIVLMVSLFLFVRVKRNNQQEIDSSKQEQLVSKKRTLWIVYAIITLIISLVAIGSKIYSNYVRKQLVESLAQYDGDIEGLSRYSDERLTFRYPDTYTVEYYEEEDYNHVCCITKDNYSMAAFYVTYTYSPHLSMYSKDNLKRALEKEMDDLVEALCTNAKESKITKDTKLNLKGYSKDYSGEISGIKVKGTIFVAFDDSNIVQLITCGQNDTELNQVETIINTISLKQ